MIAPMDSSRSVNVDFLRSEPVTRKFSPIDSNTSAMPLIPMPPIPTKWMCLTLLNSMVLSGVRLAEALLDEARLALRPDWEAEAVSLVIAFVKSIPRPLHLLPRGARGLDTPGDAPRHLLPYPLKTTPGSSCAWIH